MSIEYKPKIHRCKFCEKILSCPGNHKTERHRGGWACYDCFHANRLKQMIKIHDRNRSLGQTKRQHDLIRSQFSDV